MCDTDGECILNDQHIEPFHEYIIPYQYPLMENKIIDTTVRLMTREITKEEHKRYFGG